MPFREVDIQYGFPLNEDHKRYLIHFHSRAERKWLSTAVVGGKMRMRFGRFEWYVETAPEIERGQSR